MKKLCCFNEQPAQHCRVKSTTSISLFLSAVIVNDFLFYVQII